MRRLTDIQCFMWRAVGKTSMAMAAPIFALDWCFERAAEIASKAVSLLCAAAALPNVVLYDFCVKKHNELRRRAIEGGDSHD